MLYSFFELSSCQQGFTSGNVNIENKGSKIWLRYVAFLHCSYCRDSDRVIRENVMAEVLPKNKFLTKTAKLKAKVVAEKMKARAGKAKMSGGKSSAGTKVAKKMKKPASATGSKKGKNTNGSKSQGKRKAKSV